MAVEEVIFKVSEALRWPVLIMVIIGVALALMELGALTVELSRRRIRSFRSLDRAIDAAKQALSVGDSATALIAVRSVAWNEPMRDAIGAVIEERSHPEGPNRIAKRMADYDYRSLRRLERTRILVRAGPALGLMGTLIPLSPALAGLADGNITELTDNLRVAFSVTVSGLVIGAIAFGVSLVRDRLYAQDYSDVEYVAAGLAPPEPQVPGGQQPGQIPSLSHPGPPIHPAHPPAGAGATAASSTDPLTGYSP